MRLKPKSLVKAAKTWVTGHGPELATAGGIAFMFAASVIAVKQTPKAITKLKEAEKEKKEELTVPEKIKATGMYYVPSVVCFAVGAGLTVCGQRATARKAAAFATAYTLSEQMLQEYKDAAKEVVGEKKADEIADQAAIQQVQHNPPQQTIIVTGKGKQLCLDSYSQHYFYSNSEHILQVVDELNKRFAGAEDFIPLMDWYYENNITEAADMEIGDDLGFNRDDGGIEVRFSSTLGTGDFENIPILVVQFKNRPKPRKNTFGNYDFS